MNKILIALVFAVLMSGNVYAKMKSVKLKECQKALLKGEILSESGNGNGAFFSVLYKGKIYSINQNYSMLACSKFVEKDK